MNRPAATAPAPASPLAPAADPAPANSHHLPAISAPPAPGSAPADPPSPEPSAAHPSPAEQPSIPPPAGNQPPPAEPSGADPEASSAAGGWAAFHAEYPIVLAVLLAGAIGGYVGYIFDLSGLSKLSLAGLGRQFPAFAALLAGACAAGITVFYLAKSDRRNIWHCIFLALICGMIGPTILGKAVTNMGASDPIQAALVASSQVAVASAAVVTQATQGDSATFNEKTTELAGAATAAIASAQVAEKANDLPAISAANAAAMAAVRTLSSTGQEARTSESLSPEVSIAALQDIAVQAERANNPLLAQAATSAADELQARVYLIVPTAELGTRAADSLADPLARSGFTIARTTEDPGMSPAGASVIYYHASDVTEAQRLAALVQATAGEPALTVTARPWEGSSSAKSRHFDLHLGPETIARLPAPEPAP